MDNLDLPNTFLCTIVFHAHENVPSPVFLFRCTLYDRMAYISLPPVLYIIHFASVVQHLEKMNLYHISIYTACFLLTMIIYSFIILFPCVPSIIFIINAYNIFIFHTKLFQLLKCPDCLVSLK